MIKIPEQVKMLYRSGNIRKNYRIVFSDVDRADITNDHLCTESVKINEKLCSSSKLKFGLCEGSALEFKCFNESDLSGLRLQVFNEIDCSSLPDGVEGVVYRSDLGFKVYPVPMGYYTVTSSITEASTGITKVVAYNKLQSAYLDADAKAVISSMTGDTSSSDTVTVYSIEERLLDDYQIERASTGIELTTSAVQTTKVTGITFKIGTTTYTLGVEYKLKQFNINASSDYACAINWTPEYIEQVNSEDGQDYFDGFFRDIQNGEITNPDALITKIYANSFLSSIMSGYPVVCYTADESTEYKMDFYETVVGAKYVSIAVPLTLYGISGSTRVDIASGGGYGSQALEEAIEGITCKKTKIDPIEQIKISKTNVPDVTLRDIVSAHYELLCQFGKLDRESDLFSGVELAQGALYPSEDLYPNTSLYPSGSVEGTPRSIYSELFTNAQSVDTFRYLVITYKALDSDGNEIEKRLQRTVNTNGTVNYNMSNNWIMLNQVWTEAEVGEYADAMVEKMQNLRWFPFEMTGVGLPYLECGDMIEINSQYDGSHSSYILERDLKGIWALEDEFGNGTVNTF